MEKLLNNTKNGLTKEQEEAINDAAALIEDAFGRNIFSAMVRPYDDDQTDIYGVAFVFDLRSKRLQKKW